MRRCFVAALFPVYLFACLSLSAQSPIALPYTMTTLGGTSPMAATAGTQCPSLTTGVVSIDAYGDGCLAVNGIFGNNGSTGGPYGGVLVDPYGNVFMNDDIKGVLHMINPNSGIMTAVGGAGSACSSKVDSSGDGCVASTGTPSTPYADVRGVGIDPYGNILLAGYNDHLIHIICRYASPICVSGTAVSSAAAPIQVPIGNMGLVAGCAYASGSAGVTGAGLDNTPAFTTAPGFAGYSGSAFVNPGTSSSSCTTSLGEVDQPRGVTGDAYGNVYFGDTASERYRVVLGPQSYNGVSNPLWTILALNPAWATLHAGYVYTIANTATAATVASSTTNCNGGGTATDTHGDGCLFTSASLNSSSSGTQGMGVDAAGNLVFMDSGNGLLRVLFVSGTGTAGAAMTNAIEANNSSMSPSTPQTGFVYSLAGGGSTGGVSATPALGNTRTALDSSTTKLTVSPQGNIFIGDKTRVLFYDINTGYIRILFTSVSSNVTSGSSCGSTVSLSAYSDGCPAANAEFGNTNGVAVGVDALGNLYMDDGSSNASQELVRKVVAQGIAPQTMAVSRKQIFETHAYGATAATSSAAVSATPDMSAVSPACTLNGDSTVDCTVTVTSTPSATGLRSATLTVTNTASGSNANVSLEGTVSGSALAFDNVSTTANNTTTSVAPTTNVLLRGISPAGVAPDGAGNVYAANGTTIAESIGGNAYTLSTASSVPIALPAIPSQIAVDGLGDVYAVSSSSAAIDELAIAAAGTPSAYALKSIAYMPCSGCTASPRAIAADAAGNLYVADVQSSQTNTAVYKLSLVGGVVRQQSTIAIGLANPVSLAVDASGNVYVADKSADAVYKLAPASTGAYTQTTLLTSVVPVGVATDAAGNVYVQDEGSASILEVPVTGPETPVLTGLQEPVGVAVDGLGNVYDADERNTGIVQIVRDAGSYGSLSTPLTSIGGTLTNVGNLAATGTLQTAASAFTISPSGCTIGSASAFAAGEACPLSVALSTASLENPGTTYTDTLSFLAASSVGSVTFSDIVPAGPTATTLTGPATTLYAASGTEASFTISVSGIASPNGSPVSVTVTSLTLSGNAVVYSSAPTLNASGVAVVSLSGLAPGNYSITATYAGVANTYASSSESAAFTILQYVATGDSRTVTEPAFPGVCTVLNADLAIVNNDIPASVDATVTNPDGARIQAALNNCSGTGQAVELSVGSGGSNGFLSGPLSMPANVTLLVDPGVVLFFSRNVQDYDTTPGTHTCGTVNNNSATASCLPLIDIPGGSTNVGIMGFGKIDGRGGDPLINAFPASFVGQSWWGLSSIANGGGTQQNPRFVQMDGGASNITLYKITLRNSPLFHVSTTGAVSNFTAWDIKIITPTSSRNTDGIDPGNATNFTITRSWISDGDDNIAVGAAGSAPASNISVINNRLFAGHGESIGSYTQAGVSNVLFDRNMLSGNAIAGSGSSVNNTADSNSTGIRIKSGFDRGGVVTNIQYSNSCFQDHKAEIVFSPNYENTTGNASPNLGNILMQNLTFLTAGTAQFTGTNNNGTVYPLGLTLDNVTFPGSFPASEFSPAPTNAALSYGPGQVSSNFVTDYATFVGSNGNTVTNNITQTSLNPPQCSFTYIAPELTGPNGVSQTITEGQNATAVVILMPAVGGAAYPTGTVTLTDALTSSSTTVSLPGSTDTIFVPLTGLAPGTHTFTATYSGDSNYTLNGGQTVYSTTSPYVVTVNAGSLAGTTTVLSGVPGTISFGTSFTPVATITGSNPTGSVEFVVNGTVFATAAVSSGSASASITLPYSVNAYSIYAVYSGDGANDGSTSATASVAVTPALTITALSANTTTTTLGHPVALSAAVSSAVGAPTGTVTFTYTTTGSGVPQATTATLVASTPNASVATAGIALPVGTDNVTATYTASGSFAGSSSTPMQFTVTQGTILALPSNPIALPYTMTTLAGGATANCSAATDNYGDGCPATSIVFSGSVDLRSVAADPFGNVYLTDAVASLVRRIAPNGVITNFAGKVSGSACAPTGTAGCTPTQVSIDKPRGVSSDAQGNIYIAGYDSHAIYKVSASTGLLYLEAGTGSAGSSGDGGPATSAQVNAPRGVWADTAGNVYIADTSNNKIRVVDITGAIHTFAGTGTASSSGDGGLATSATIDNPQGVMTDANLNVYIADTQKIRVVCVTCGTGSPLDALLAALGVSSPQNGYIYTVAGGAASSYAGTYPTLATNVTMSPQKLAIDNSGDIYISDGNGVAWFLDAHTAYIRPIAGKTSTNCSSAADAFGDGCPATQAVIGNGGNGIGVGTDPLGNLYISDTLNDRIRKVTTSLASPATTVASTTALPVELHFIAGDNLAAVNGLVDASSEWSLATPTCTTNSDSTADCLLTSSFTPAVPGARSSALTVNSAAGNIAYLGLTGIGLGSGATLDPATQVSFAANLAVTGLATDNAGNVYVSDTNSKQVFRYAPAAQSQGASATGIALATFQAPGAVAVDARGYVYVADTSAGTVTAISPAGASSALPFTFTTPAGLAVDALNNLYVSDSSAKTVYQIDPITGAERTLPLGTLAAPAGLSIDPNGNLLVADPGAPAIDRFNFQSNAVTGVTTTAVAPSAALADAAGNLLIADTADILAVPASSNSASFAVASITPVALAIDSAGNLYTGSAGGILKLTRTQGYVQFSASEPPQTVEMLESGNQAFSGTSFSQTDTSDYNLAPAASTDCALNATGSGTLAIGGACVLTAAYTPTTYSTTTDTVTFNGNLTNAALSDPSSVELTLTGPAAAPASNITLGAFSPASPVYGQSVTLNATVSGTSVTPTGTVVFTVDSTMYNATLSNGMATTVVSGLTAGSHQVSAAYASTNGYASATSTTSTLEVAQATPSVTWATPSAITYGTALSSTQLDATSTVSGSFVYTPAVGTVLGAGTQTLSVTLTPTDTTDYTTATQNVQLVVNQATPSITWATPSAITYGTALSSTQLNATSTVSGSFVYTPAAGTVLGAGTQTLSVTLTPTDTTDYTTATQTVQLVVNQATPSITWAAPSAITYGTALSSAQLDATSTVSGNFVYTPAAGAVLGAGTHILSVTFTPSDTTDYTTTTQTVQLMVNRATPSVTWATPAAITYGTALSLTQLDATSTVSGNFAYSPAAGAVLGAGTQTLSVTLTPTDTTDYTTAMQTVQLIVNKASSAVTLSANLNPGVQGKTETLTATVTGAGQPGGTLIFLSGATTLCTSTLNASGVATCTFTPSASGALALSAQYQGDANHLASSASLALNVYDTAVTEQFASTQLVYPGATNVTVCVTGATKATPTGTIQIDDGTTVLTTLTLGGNGCAYWYISPGLSAGSHNITSVYSGDKNNPAGTSDPTVLTVSSIPVNMSASCWNSSFPYGGNYQCTVNVSSNAGSAQGNITYSYDGGTPVAVPLSNGNAQFTITKPPVGNQSLVIGYAQQTNYAAATPQTETFTVTAAPVQVSLTPSTWYTTVGSSITFSAAVTSSSAGPPSNNGAVSFYDGATLLATIPVNASGQASYTTSSLPAGSQTITATYAGGANYASGSSSVTITLVP